MTCPCHAIEDELKCELDICPHISPRRGWIIGDQIDLALELVRFGICDSKKKAKTLVNQGSVRVFDGKTWNKTELGDRFLPRKETFVTIGKKKVMCHFLIPKEIRI